MTTHTTHTPAGFIPAATLDALRDVLATLPDDFPNSNDAFDDNVRDYFANLAARGAVTLRASDELTVSYRGYSADMVKSDDAGENAARNNSASVELVVGFDVSRNGVSAICWARVYFDAHNGGHVARYGGSPVFARHSEPTFYNDTRGRFEPLPDGAMRLLREYVGDVFAGVPVSDNEVARVAWYAHAQRETRAAARGLVRALEIARLSAAHYQ